MQLWMRPGAGAPRQSITVADGQLGAGGAGSVRKLLGDDLHVVKLYHKPSTELAAKIAAMLAAPPANQVVHSGAAEVVEVAWPNALVEDANGNFLGYRMRRIDLSQATTLEELLTRAQRDHAGHRHDLAFRLFTARNLAAVVAEVHQVGHVVVDMKPPNVLVYRDTGFVGLLDCDGFTIRSGGRTFPADMFTVEYLCPEGHGSSPGRLGAEQDAFAFATIAFQLLNEGIHPFQGRPGPLARESDPTDLAGAIVAGIYPYGRDGRETRRVPAARSLHAGFPADLRVMFDRAFAGQYLHRPTLVEWREQLNALTAVIKRCDVDPSHEYLGEKCEYCAVAKRRDEEKARQRAAPPPPPNSFRKPAPASTTATPGTAPTAPTGRRSPFAARNQTPGATATAGISAIFGNAVTWGWVVAILLLLGWALIPAWNTVTADRPTVPRSKQVRVERSTTVITAQGERVPVSGGVFLEINSQRLCNWTSGVPVRVADGRQGIIELDALGGPDSARLSGPCTEYSRGQSVEVMAPPQTKDLQKITDASPSGRGLNRRQQVMVVRQAPVIARDGNGFLGMVGSDTLLEVDSPRLCDLTGLIPVRLGDGRLGKLSPDYIREADSSRLYGPCPPAKPQREN